MEKNQRQAICFKERKRQYSKWLLELYMRYLEYGSYVCMERFASDLFPVYRIIL